ncbi:hypothetical protein [Prolixibacter sp. NT017]|uniref:hypothetical protein n=1 Tax=Prolixibacter sp. NT017 TaxID=2652390 RepID=UPI001282B4FD|nr:hypothetical protein [Prolixibacter sp. NT017]GET25996.1 hypothetical protein NT017_23250 [Prolixibacter sp. NT017]
MFLQFGEDDKVDIILWDNGKIDKNLENKTVLDDYGLRLQSQKLDSILNLIHFKQEYLIRLKHDLAEINCKSIGYKHKIWHIHNSVGAIEIGYITHDFYGLDYIITDTIDQDFLNEAKEMCNYKIINNKVLVRFQGPSWGDDGGVNWCGE